MLWNYKFNPATADLGLDMKVTANGHAYALVKSTATGNVIRNRMIKATGAGTSITPFYNFNAFPDYPTSLALDGDQHSYVTGYRLLNGVKTILIASVNNAGALRWIRTENCGTATGDDFGRHVAIGADGQIYMTGSSQGTAQHGIDVVTMKFNYVTGKKQWENFINYNLNDGGYFVASPTLNAVYVSWIAGNVVFVDQIAATTGLAGRRASYTPAPTAPFDTRTGATISDMKISSGTHIYLTGNIGAISAGLNYQATYLIKVNFIARSSSRIEIQLPVTGNFLKSRKSNSIALHNPDKSVFLLEDTYEDYSTHQTEAVVLINLYAPGVFRNQQEQELSADPDSFTMTVAPDPASASTRIIASEPIAFISIQDLTGKKVMEVANDNPNNLGISTWIFLI